MESIITFVSKDSALSMVIVGLMVGFGMGGHLLLAFANFFIGPYHHNGRGEGALHNLHKSIPLNPHGKKHEQREVDLEEHKKVV